MSLKTLFSRIAVSCIGGTSSDTTAVDGFTVTVCDIGPFLPVHRIRRLRTYLLLAGVKNRPASLKLTAASPLLQTSFPSPMTSSRVQSGSSSLLSLTASATSLSPPLGSASSLRGKPENGGGPTNLTSPIEVSKNEDHPQRIIMEDDEESSGFVVAHSVQDNSPRSADRGTLPGHAASEASQVLPVSTPSSTPASPPDNLSLSSFPFPPQ